VNLNYHKPHKKCQIFKQLSDKFYDIFLLNFGVLLQIDQNKKFPEISKCLLIDWPRHNDSNMTLHLWPFQPVYLVIWCKTSKFLKIYKVLVFFNTILQLYKKFTFQCVYNFQIFESNLTKVREPKTELKTGVI